MLVASKVIDTPDFSEKNQRTMDKLCILFLHCMDRGQKKYFTSRLMQWHETENSRTLPWKKETDPYKIWLSEIILQQTRALQGLPYYEKFIDHYPTINHMAKAKDEEAFRLWQGLGYYNRCRNMLFTARYISNELQGNFPKQYEDILSLKGVGAYTAAAIASFAYGAPHAVLDGNVYRVTSRYFGIDTPIDTTEGKKEFAQLAGELLYKADSASYNQAIMDLGATICTPKTPQCNICPLQQKCFAFRKNSITDLPVKSKKLQVKTRHFHYLLFIYNEQLWIRKRTGKDIWQNLYEPFLVEADTKLDKKDLLQHELIKPFNLSKQLLVYDGSLSQRLTHRVIRSEFYSIFLESKPKPLKQTGLWVPLSEISGYAFPKTLVSFIEKKSYF